MTVTSKRPRRAGRIAGIVLGAGVGLALLLTVVSYWLPSQVEALRISATVQASSAEVFTLFNTRAGQKRLWRFAAERAGIPPMSLAALGGPDAGVGSRSCFCPTSEGRGVVLSALSSMARGEGAIVESVPNRRVVYDIDWEFMLTRRTMTFEDLGDNRTRVSWVETNEATNPLMRYVLVLSASSINDNLSGMLTAVAPVITPESAPAPGR